MRLRYFASLLTFAVLPLQGAEPPSVIAQVSGAERKFGMPANVDSVTVPLDSTMLGLFVEVHINGEPVKLLLSTSTSRTVLSPEAASKLGLEVVPIEGAGTAQSSSGGRLSTERALIGRLSLGDAWTENEWVLTVSTPGGIDGQLGLSTLVNWDVRIDPAMKHLTLFPAGKAEPLDDEQALPLTFHKNGVNFSVPIRVGNNALTANPATEDSRTLQLPEALIKEIAPEVMRAAQPALVTGTNSSGDVVSRTAELPEFSFGPDALRGLQIDVLDAVPDSAADRRGVIGLNLLRHYVMTFRFSEGELRLKPLGTVQEIVSTSTAGIHMIIDGGGRIVISAVVPDGPAARAGLRAGDEMLEIEGRALRTMKPEEFAAFKRLPPGANVKVRYRRGGAEPVEATLVLVKE